MRGAERERKRKRERERERERDNTYTITTSTIVANKTKTTIPQNKIKNKKNLMLKNLQKKGKYRGKKCQKIGMMTKEMRKKGTATKEEGKGSQASRGLQKKQPPSR